MSFLTQSVSFGTGLIIFKSTICFNCCSNLAFKVRGIFLAGVTRGATLSLISIWSVFLRLHISPKQSGNSHKNCLLFMFTTEINFIRFKLSLVDNLRIGMDFESTKINETSQ